MTAGRISWAATAGCLAWVLGMGCQAPTQSQGGGTATVEFVAPERYTDLRRSRETSQESRDQVLPALEAEIKKAARRWLPEDVTLEVRILDINQAGYAYMGNPGPQRVERATDRSEVRLEYRVQRQGANPGSVVPETLAGFYESTRDRNRSGPLPVIQRLLEDWVRSVGKRL